MNDKLRNTIVGLTIIGALVLVTWGAFLLGRVPGFGPNTPYNITLLAPTADGLTYGDLVTFNGVTVGTVASVSLTPDMQSAKIIIGIYRTIRLPANTVAQIGSKTIGAAYVSLYLPGKADTKMLPVNGSATIQASVESSSLIPKSVVQDFSALKTQFGVLSDKLDRVADDLHVLLKPVVLTKAQAEGAESNSTDLNNISALIQRLNVTINSINDLVSNGKLRGEVHEILGNVAVSSEELKSTLKQLSGTIGRFNGVLDKAGTTATDIDAVARTAQQKIVLMSVKLTRVLENVNAITESIAQGHGTAGRLVKDPRLYNSLLVLTRRLKGTVDSLHGLVKQIKAEGFDVKVGF
jgi:phospholipid/cholesterol/gamma-HCH transport system substrate-binding protein